MKVDAHTEKICIIGAGLAGLSAAFDLGRSGYDITILEASEDLGGLASSLNLSDIRLERFYHFICTGDRDLTDLIDELGIGHKLHCEKFEQVSFMKGACSTLDHLLTC